jgi:hypothetical protein
VREKESEGERRGEDREREREITCIGVRDTANGRNIFEEEKKVK